MADTITGTTTSPAAAAASAAAPTIGADFDMFLKLLTTQMQNQDPLSPMDSTEYTAQLVQYSQVEQSIKQTGALEDILSRLDTQNLTQAASLVGQIAEFDHAISGLSASVPAHWGYTADRAVETITAAIKDDKGKTVATSSIKPDATGRFSWDGKLASGSRAPDGAYTLSLSGVDAGGDTVPMAVTSIGKVNEIVTSAGSVTLGVNGASIALDKLRRLTTDS